ncbi:hypothetical protein L6452_35768 [Arctium lappa]|uniref:Uncharacterized protein n=1 Tax=Arctium lappa TaxID=4217 RepID=A0ACB8Y7D5_ARCLA|nr:hypothetical protein L6452_35768 [Arctium lappa]
MGIALIQKKKSEVLLLRTAPSMYSGPPPIAGRCARYDKGPWEKPMKSQGRASEPAQAKIGTRRPPFFAKEIC